MDIVSHGLWGGIAFGRKNKKSFWLSFFFGVMPDLFSFGPFFVTSVLGISKWPRYSTEPGNELLIPEYVKHLYNTTHSFLIFLAVFFLVWLIFKRPVMELLAWGVHIIFDIFTHSYQFFPTPFLWPALHLEVNGIPWGNPLIFVPDVVLLTALYVWFFIYKRYKTNASKLL